MLLENVRIWFGGAPSATPVSAPLASMPADADFESDAPPRPDMVWPPARVNICEGLWGEGFLFPGGADEIMRFVRPLGLSSEATLLLVGAGCGGPAATIATQLGVWIAGFESDPDLAALAMERITRSRLGRRVQVEMWCPSNPQFRPHAYHHGLALEPLGDVMPEPVLAAIAGALKPGGQLAILQTVADEPLDPADRSVKAWCQLERRSAILPTERAVTRMLGRLGFDVRTIEDLTERHKRLAVLGWRSALRSMEETRPAITRTALLIQEAERWLMRERLMREGRLRLVRWHAIAPRRELG